MRSWAVVAAVLFVALSWDEARAEEKPASPAQPASPVPEVDPAKAATERARAHFKAGIRLYRDGNYAGSLAEFEAAYEEKPGPGSLQNVALCQKALFRYGEAADTLTRLLTRHDAELSDAERTAARLARDELRALVGSIRVTVTPADAKVTLDGQPLPDKERLVAVRVNVGEHTFVAEAPGYARATRTVRVAGGQLDLPVALTLEPVLGFLDVRASDPAAAIAIDGKAVALGHWVGPVAPGDDHLVQVYRAGFEPFEDRVRVDVGERLQIEGKLGHAERGALPPPVAEGALPAPPSPKPPVGYYGLLSFNVQGTGAAAFGLDLSRARSLSGAFGLRAGRRLRPNVGVDALLELGSLSVKNACDPEASGASGEPQCGIDYRVRWARFGPSLRVMTPADRLRVAGGIGGGIVWHELRLRPGQKPGVDPYLLVELGVASNWRKFLFGLDLFALVDGTRGINAERNGRSAFPGGKTLGFIGLGVRGGYSEWGAPP